MPLNPSPGSTRASIQTQWWVVRSKFGIQVVSSSTRPGFTIGGPFTSQTAADKFAQSQLANFTAPWDWPKQWLQSAGADIGSGIESGFVTFFKDLWNVIVGPIEVLGGLAIVIVVFLIYFKDDIMQAAMMAGVAAA